MKIEMCLRAAGSRADELHSACAMIARRSTPDATPLAECATGLSAGLAIRCESHQQLITGRGM
jgi:hypothetical protein